MSNVVYTFAELGKSMFGKAGGKAASLARLCQAGFPVPEGIVVMPGAFSGETLTVSALPEIRAQVALMGDRMKSEGTEASFAVRSSATSEDSTYTSFAGAFETILNVREDAALVDAIETVRRSFSGKRASAYGAALGVDKMGEMSVVIQRMVNPEFAGVLFTVDPLGAGKTMLGNYVSGLGESLVSGESTPLSFSFDKTTGDYQGPDELTPWATSLFKLGSAVESEMCGPQDIEWAIGGGRLWVLQSRPITTLDKRPAGNMVVRSEGRDDYLWSNGNVGEATPDVMTPSTWSLWAVFYNDTMPFAIPGGHPMTANIGGRAYINLSLLLALYMATMKPEAALDKVQQLLGRLPAGIDTPVPRISLASLVRTVPANVAWEIRARRLAQITLGWAEANQDWCKAMVQKVGSQTRPDLLQRMWPSEILPRAMRIFWTLRAVMKFFTEQADLLTADLTKLLGAAASSTLMSNLSGDGALESMGPLYGLFKVKSGNMSREQFMVLYGHRGPHEMELRYARPHEDAAWLDKRLLEISGTDDIESRRTVQIEESSRAWDALDALHPRRAPSLRGRLSRVSELAKKRELVRSETTRIVKVVREYVLKAGELIGIGDDAFFLTLDEISQTLRGDCSHLKCVGARRDEYERYSLLPAYPTFIRGAFDPEKWARAPHRRDDYWNQKIKPASLGSDSLVRGMPASTGRVEGVVRVLHSADEGQMLCPGEILVTRTTNVGWTPIFPRAAAVVTDIGAPLSHAAIVARELGIPAVVGCGDATSRLRTGDRVVVDGGHGAVMVVRKR